MTIVAMLLRMITFNTYTPLNGNRCILIAIPNFVAAVVDDEAFVDSLAY